MSTRTTIHDVAREAGVSHQTVSNVLRSTGRVGSATRERVLAAIDSLNYRPHSGAASLRTRRSGSLAYPISAGDFPTGKTIMLEFMSALTSAAGARGHHLVLTPGETDELLQAGVADAVILANIEPNDVRVKTLAARGVPFACFGRTAPEQPQNWVDIDNQAAIHAVTTYLIEQGHKRLAFFGYAPQGSWDVSRETGFRAAVTESGLPARVVSPSPEPRHVSAALDVLLDDPPTAVVTGSDVLASAVYSAAAQRGILVGSDLAVTGFDGSMVGKLLTPTLTTLSIPIGYIADTLVARAVAEIAGPTSDPGELVMPELVHGDSA
ncbi:LacI family transcriptional regulator [Kibdelosporangium philippinense]|uniref:LacI family transcriptional regulator n=1 Tax=Kibdelosporangium philippinense TaxID=211113 RepID=A0ABS8ZRM7_9PSEU|nr:LacI family DNA-binding transcriptional regulator [Kibdelosporangium philippinense]MCE7010399.1 LacI family transcriptional regulator [Kibdelosporangium philippinense]